MKRWARIAFAAALQGALIVSSMGAVIDIRVSQDVSLASARPNENSNNPGHEFLWVGDNLGDRDYQGMFGFDMSSLTSLLGVGDTLVVDGMTFNSYNNYSLYFDRSNHFVEVDSTGPVQVALANSDVWNANTVTWNSHHGAHGVALSSVIVGPADVGRYVAWDVTTVGVSEFLTDNYLSFYLFIPNAGSGDNWHDFENEEYSGTNESFLRVSYQIVQRQVPEPAGVSLLGFAVFFGIFASRRRKWHYRQRLVRAQREKEGWRYHGVSRSVSGQQAPKIRRLPTSPTTAPPCRPPLRRQRQACCQQPCAGDCNLPCNHAPLTP
ncbi:DNRLRE domain-containing protein [Accumulibacter sp.]|uniref:DNRLRE domain-containing protein n=1 Tax=Accumulibacter sp. TaxID=2053492 RepID=UPI001A421732|nr:DNRLRE domain-containing protein [Accumulibacter sp.]MBL8400603.1 DNRLRE domain-containing protein [Accumulibacter sp.]